MININEYKKKLFQVTLRPSKFIIAGLASNAVNYVVFACLAYSNFDIFLSTTSGYICGLIVSFLANRTWVFKQQGNKKFQLSAFWQTLGFLLVHGCSASTMGMILNFLVKYWEVEISLAFVIAVIPIAVFNYIALNLLIFKKHKT